MAIILPWLDNWSPIFNFNCMHICSHLFDISWRWINWSKHMVSQHNPPITSLQSGQYIPVTVQWITVHSAVRSSSGHIGLLSIYICLVGCNCIRCLRKETWDKMIFRYVRRSWMHDVPMIFILEIWSLGDALLTSNIKPGQNEEYGNAHAESFLLSS